MSIGGSKWNVSEKEERVRIVRENCWFLYETGSHPSWWASRLGFNGSESLERYLRQQCGEAELANMLDQACRRKR